MHHPGGSKTFPRGGNSYRRKTAKVISRDAKSATYDLA
jgi:hypothetical protein